ncbi:T9SS type B sorting domain-containing protein, partial [Flavobacterium terrae]
GPSGSFSYASSSYCESITTPVAVTLSGLTSGGSYSATPTGLIIDPTTGAITPNGSTPGTYTISYDIGATASCPAYSAPTVSVDINPSPTAPVVTVVQPTCTVTTGTITVTSPLGAGYEYSIDNGTNYQANPSFTGVIPNTYTVIVRDISSSCVSPATSVTINTPPGSPAIPLINTAAATCTADGSSSIVNYDATLTYVFTPAGPTVGAGGSISGMAVGTNYTVVASNTSCSSAPSASFSNDVMLTVPAVPTISSTAATCTSEEVSSISNYDATLTYMFTPVGPTVGASGLISGMVVGTSYTVTAGNGSCSSAPSASFSNDAMLAVPAVPTISSTAASCTSDELSVIGNYDATLTYVFTPVGPTVGTGGAINGMAVGTNYTVVASNTSCSSAPSASFSNDVMLTVPAVPTISSTAATCTSEEVSSISNYDATLTYMFTPVGPTVGASGLISNMAVGTSYTVTAGNGSCSSAPSGSFSNDVMLTVPAVPTISSTAASCTSDELSAIGNYDATLTYVFTPVGPTVGTGGAINGMAVGTNYTVVASNTSCSSTASASFSNDAMLPTPVLNITNPSAVCEPGTVDLTDPAVTAGSIGGGTLSYWTNSSATTPLANPSAVAVGGTYYIQSLSGTCKDIKPVTVIINSVPVVTLVDGFICVDPITQLPLNGSTYTINTNLNATDYSFQWTDSLGAPIGNGSSYVASAPGVYTVVVTSNATGCSSDPTSATVGTSSGPESLEAFVSDYFADVMSINVIATPAGNYEYSLDGGAYQSSNVFVDVSPGQHTVYVRDVNGCGAPISVTRTLIDYPRYFTPNGDGYHDTWNISALKDQPNSKIHIFDRFGKLLKEIRPSSSGWNGTFNGQDLPSTDYWFVVFYQEKGQNKEFKSHFSLKR